ncbi:hypothetical protein [uncultured Oscillibacter sp.]|uniref:hypothetical protein n=1 Tax=uncultured Oscillibacter sp. TaxID=876091 RepID=UPI0026002608|nr:hypothetical protein [uncultured Oscillibacter sp.]
MDRRRLNRITAVFLVAVVLVVAVMLTHSFRSPPSLVLPQEQDDAQQLPGSDSEQDQLETITVTPETVQTAIATLTRPAQYRRSISIEQFWEGGSGQWETSVSVSSRWQRIDRTLSGGRVRHTITDGSVTYIWYNSESRVYQAPADEITPDMEQCIPTYEDILDLPVEQIALADYRNADNYGGCIYVETEPDETGYTLCYWVSLDTGLLVMSEKLLDGSVVYRMQETAVELTPAFTDEFTLPDGTVLTDG